MESFNFLKMPYDYAMTNLSGYPLLVTILAILTMLTIFLKRKINNYMTKRGKLIEMADNYERKRQCRNDLRYHFDWAIDRGEKDSAKNIGKEILKLDQELSELYEDYQFMKEKGTFPLKKI